MNRIIGMMETNGSFVVNIIKNEKYTCGYSCGINFTFRSTENDILEHINIILKDKNIESKIKNDTLLIVGCNNLKKFTKLIDKYGNFISIKRQKNFLIFKEILNYYSNKEHLTIEGIKKIKDKKDELK